MLYENDGVRHVFISERLEWIVFRNDNNLSDEDTKETAGRKTRQIDN